MSETFSTDQQLQQRNQELTCLYQLSSVLAKHAGILEKTLKKALKLIKTGWQFPEAIIIELQLEDLHLSTRKLPQHTVSQKTKLHIFNKASGFLKVHYPQNKFQQHPFLPEEQKLLDTIGWELVSFYEREKNKEKEELFKRRAERHDRLSILGEITAGIAHELNTPLGNILGFSELIAEKSNNPQITADIQKIIKSTIFSREVVKKLMFFACEMPQNMEFIAIKPVILQALALLGPNFKKAEITHSIYIQTPNLKAQLDSIQLSQVLFNILINAIYISPKNSHIEVEISNDEKYFFIEIKDQGPGIKKEIQSKIFEPFFTTKPLGEGSGLGLSVVHGIIKSHKGSISTVNNKPQGTIFKIKLPLMM